MVFPMSIIIPDSDIAYVGFGISARLHFIRNYDKMKGKKILIVDKEYSKKPQKNLCTFTSDSNLPFTHTWHNYYYNKKKFFSRIPYKRLDINRIYDKSQELLALQSNVTILEDMCIEISKKNSLFQIQSKKQVKTVNSVYDSRPPKTREKAELYQHFYGVVLKCDHSLKSPVLMDFVDYTHGLKFFYLLPLNKNEVLVELTYYSNKLLAKEEYLQEIIRYVDQEIKEPYKIINDEYGALPLIKVENKIECENYHCLGLRAGNMRPSTGYSFAHAYQDMTKTKNNFKWKILTELDRVFLEVISHTPSLAQKLFQEMSYLKGTDLASFIGTSPQLLSILKMILIMPKLVFIKALLRTYYKRSFLYQMDRIND